MSKDKYNLSGANFAGGFAETVHGNQIGGNIYNYAPEEIHNFAEATVEIRQLLQKLDTIHPPDSSFKEQLVAEEVVDIIESNHRLKSRVIAALKAGGIEAFKETVDHPLINPVLAMCVPLWKIE
jgi:hypothetical protein